MGPARLLRDPPLPQGRPPGAGPEPGPFLTGPPAAAPRGRREGGSAAWRAGGREPGPGGRGCCGVLLWGFVGFGGLLSWATAEPEAVGERSAPCTKWKFVICLDFSFSSPGNTRRPRCAGWASAGRSWCRWNLPRERKSSSTRLGQPGRPSTKDWSQTKKK